MAKRKEELLKTHLVNYYYHKGREVNDNDILPVSRIKPLMEEYAQQESKESCIELLKWVLGNSVQKIFIPNQNDGKYFSIEDAEKLFSLYY